MKVTEFSWAWHPVHGVFTLEGYMRHQIIERQHPEILDLDGEFYDTPIGYARIENDELRLVRYDHSIFCQPGSNTKAIAKEVEKTLRENHNLSKSLKTIIIQPQWWN